MKNFEEKFEELREKGFIDFVTFHPTYSYEEFIEGYKPVEPGKRSNNNAVQFELRDGIFKRMCLLALDRLASEIKNEEWEKPDEEEIGKKWKKLSEEEKKKALSNENVEKVLKKSDGKFVLIIDEINRANISKVFGELIYAIEYRGKPVKLLYSQEDLIVPPNLFIIGTMNTADKSIALLDIALRRRFGFKEFMPETEFYKIVEEASQEEGNEPITREDIENGLNGLDLEKLLETINSRITFLADREKQIGHSYFLKIFKDKNGIYRNNPELWRENLTSIWYNEIIPLLQEYFYNDYEKIKMILGKEFVKKVENPKFLEESAEFIEELKRYEVREKLEGDNLINALKEIYSNEERSD